MTLFKILRTIFVSLIFISYISACNSGEPFQATVDSMRLLTRNLEIPDHFLVFQGDSIKVKGDFDVNAYFSVLDHLQVEPGYTLDYVYIYESIAGEPVIYARPLSQYPYTSYAEYVDATKGEYRGAFGEYTAHNTDYLAHVQADDTETGYFQYALLHIMGGQFYLWWHSNYDDIIVVCNQRGLEAVLASADNFIWPSRVPEEVRREAEKIGFRPIVNLTKDSAVVRVVTFTNWGGFEERVFTISREFPHRIIDLKVKTLVEYECGLNF